MDAPGVPPNVEEKARHGVGEHRDAAANARAIGMLGGAQGLTLATGFIRWKIVALFLGPAGVGIAGVIDQIAIVVLQFGSLNIPTVALRFLAIARDDSAASFARLFRGFLRAIVVGCGVASAVAALAFLFRPSLLGEGLTPHSAALILALVTAPVTAVGNLLRSVFSTLRRYTVVAGTLLFSALMTALAALVGVTTSGLTGLYVASLAASLVATLAMHAIAVRDPALRGGGSAGTIAVLREHPAMLRYSATLYAVGFTVPLGYAIVRSTVLHAWGADMAGYLAASYTIATGARTVFAQASAQLLTPLASRAADKSIRAAEVWSYLRTLTVAMAVAALPVVLFPHEVLTLLFSAQFAAAVGYLGFFLLAELMLAFGDSYRVLLLGFDDLGGYLATTLSAPLLLIAGAAILIPRYGIIAAGAAQIAAAIVSLGVSLLRLRRRHGMRPDVRALSHYGAMIVSIAAGTVVGQIASDGSIAASLTKALVGVLLGALLITTLPRSDRKALSRILRRKGDRGANASASPPP